METIYIIGFHGVGKRMVGRVLASRKNLEYLDIDTYIEEKENKRISDVIKESGIEHYRSIGKYALKNSVKQGMIVSVGAEIVNDEETIHTMKKTGRSIYLKGSADTIYKRLNDNDSDIAFFSNSLSTLEVEKKFNEYKSYYEELQNYAVDIDDKDFKEVIADVLAIYNYINKVKCHIYI